MNKIKVRNKHIHLTDEPRGNHLTNRCLTCDVRVNGFYIKGWRKETWLNVSYKTTKKLSKVEMYQKNGAFEIDIILNKKPFTNIFIYKIQTGGLNFWYQPPLNRNEIRAGYIRPENIIGSYAVYHKIKRHDSGNGNYGTGKFCHIYRPEAIDALGKKVWCDLDIDVDVGTMTITVPQDFLDNAIYPVRIDPEFGYNAYGVSSVPQSDIFPEMFLNQHNNDGLSGVVGTMTKLFWYGYATDSNVINVQMAVYDKNFNDISNSVLIGTSNTTQISGSSAQWHGHTIDLSIDSSKIYIIGAASDFVLGVPPWAVSIYYDTVGYSSRAIYSLSSPITFPDLLGSVTPTASSVWSLYGEYIPLTETDTIQSNAYIVDSTHFEYDTTLTFLESSEMNRDIFDIKLKYICNHNLSTGQFTLDTCPRCLGTGYYYDVKFNEAGKLTEISLEDKLQQALEKLVLTEENKFHEDVAIDLKKWLGNAPASKIMAIIKYDLTNSITALKDDQKRIIGLSPRAQILSIDNIEVTILNVNSLRYTVTITTISGEIVNLAGIIRFPDVRLIT